MQLYDRIGTMVFTQNDRYIVGASDKENEEFRKKSQDVISMKQEKLRDTLEVSCVKKRENSSENYDDYFKITKMPKHCFADNYGIEIQKNVKSVIQAYCNGEITKDEIKKTFIDVCKDMRVYQAQSRHTTGNDVEDNRQIVENVYEIFQKSNVECMVAMCFKLGSNIADVYGGSEKNNWVYYDSECCSESQYLQELLQTTSSEIASEWCIGMIDFEKIEEESKLKLNGGLDFNSVWNWSANQRGICSMVEDWKAEEKFSFFFQANKNRNFAGNITLDSQAGICVVGMEDDMWILEVPFNGSVVLGELKDYYNAKDLFMEVAQNSDSNVLKYVMNFEIYTRFYGHNKTMRGE